MAYQLVGYTFRGVDVPAAYLRVSAITLNKHIKRAEVGTMVYASHDMAVAGVQPLDVLPTVIFDGDVYESTFGAVPGSIDDPELKPVNADDITIAQAYLMLKQHPDQQQLLAGAVAV